MNNNLPPNVAVFAARLDAEPERVQLLVQYGLAMAMAETNKAHVVNTEPTADGMLVMIQTVAGDVFTVFKPEMDEATEAVMMDTLRQILAEEGELTGWSQ